MGILLEELRAYNSYIVAQAESVLYVHGYELLDSLLNTNLGKAAIDFKKQVENAQAESGEYTNFSQLADIMIGLVILLNFPTLVTQALATLNYLTEEMLSEAISRTTFPSLRVEPQPA